MFVVLVIVFAVVIGAIAIIIMSIIYSSCILTYDDSNSNKVLGHTAIRKPEFVQFVAMWSRNFCK